MKILALNSSPRSSRQSKTGLMLNQLVAGMRDAGAMVEVVALRQKNIRDCLGCLTCWTKTPGICVHKDDMSTELFPKWLASDIVVYATPLYNYSMTATMKKFIERTIPSLQPFFEIKDGRMYHPLRYKNPAVVILSVSGMPDKCHFGPLSELMRYYLSSPGRKLAAEIYRPAAELITIPFFKEKADDILEATTQAGRELAQSLEISALTMEKIIQPLVDTQSFVEIANAIWKTCIAERINPKEFAARGISMNL